LIQSSCARCVSAFDFDESVEFPVSVYCDVWANQLPASQLKRFFDCNVLGADSRINKIPYRLPDSAVSYLVGKPPVCKSLVDLNGRRLAGGCCGGVYVDSLAVEADPVSWSLP